VILINLKIRMPRSKRCKKPGAARESYLCTGRQTHSVKCNTSLHLTARFPPSVKFMFDGLVLKPNQTPQSQDMEDEDIIDVEDE